MRIALEDVRLLGRNLQRCEGVMCARDGTVWAADGRGGCTRLAPDGSHEALVGQVGGEPNGICLDREGRIVIANLAGAVQRLDPRTGRHEVLATEASGRPTPSPNFPFVDRQGGLWVSNSTARADLMEAITQPAGDGFLFCVRDGRSEIVADGLWFANGVAVDAAERFVYVAESSAARVMRFPIRDDGSLGAGEQYGPDLGTAPDGIAFDEAANLWVTLPVRNAIGIITAGGAWEVVIADPDATVMRLPTNICFGGPDRRTAYIGNLPGPSLPTFRVPVPGMALVHQL
jgi:sugar lactone lactonase YvrE